MGVHLASHVLDGSRAVDRYVKWVRKNRDEPLSSADDHPSSHRGDARHAVRSGVLDVGDVTWGSLANKRRHAAEDYSHAGAISMPLFGRKNQTPRPVSQGSGPLKLDSGRRLNSALPVDRSIAALSAAVESYRPRPYEHTPSVYPVGFVWFGEDPPPTRVVGFYDVDSYPALGAFWEMTNGAAIGLFPLGMGVARLNEMPLVGHIMRQDPTLQSNGTFPAGSIGLTPPPLPEEFFTDVLNTAGYPTTDENIARLKVQVSTMFQLRAWEHIKSQDPVAADRFTAAHSGGYFPPQQVLHDLVAWKRAFVPYIQELPWRVRGIILEDAGKPGTFWETLKR